MIVNYMSKISEDIKNIKEPHKLSQKVENAVKILNKAKESYLKDMNNMSITKSENPSANENVAALFGDYWELVDACRNFAKFKPIQSESAKKAVFDWESKFYPLIIEVNSLIEQWNKKHNSNIPKLEKRVKIPLREEEKYFDY